MTKTVNKVGAGLEDFALGNGRVSQTRGSSNVDITQVDAEWLFSTVAQIQQIDTSKINRVGLKASWGIVYYNYVAAESTADDTFDFLAPNSGTGRWVREQTAVPISYTTNIGTADFAGVLTGFKVKSSFYGTAKTSGSDAELRFTGTTTLGKAGNCPDADGYFYDAVGRQFEIVGTIEPVKFGADPTGVSDAKAAIVAALAYASARQIANAYLLDGAGGTTRPREVIDFGDRKAYRIGSKITVPANLRFEIRGEKSVIAPDDFADYVFACSGNGTDIHISGITCELTRTGFFDMDFNNISGALVTFEGCRFVDDPYGYHTGIAIRYLNISSQLRISRTYFNRVKHPLHNRGCDLVLFDNQCWFGFAINSVYSDKSAYILNDAGFMKIDHALFAGGPSQATVGGDPNGTEIAYINCGTEADGGDARISITNTRIGYEAGAGCLVNYFASHYTPADATQFRNGVYLNNIQTAPREDKSTGITGVTTAPLLRLFTMPNEIVAENVWCNNGVQALVVAGSTTSLATLRAAAENFGSSYVGVDDFTADYMDSLTITANGVYSAKNFVSPISTIALTTDQEEYDRWLHMFGLFNFIFPSDNPNDNSGSDATPVTVETWFDGFDKRRGAAFEVVGGGYARVNLNQKQMTPIHGWVYVQYHENTDTLYATFVDNVDYSNLALGFSISAGFIVSGSYTATTDNANSAAAKLAIRCENTSGTDVRVRGLQVRPMRTFWPSQPNGGMRQS